MMRTVFLALVFLLLFQNHAFAQDNGSTIRVGIFQNHPIVFIDDDGVPQGLYIDLLREIANDEGWDIQFVPGTWTEGLERLRSNEIDIMTSIAYLDEREVYMDFSHENVLTMWGQVYVHQDSDIQDILDLQGETVAILNDGINGINFMDMVSKFDIQCEFKVLGTYAEVAELVASGDVAAGVINNVHGYEQEKQYAIMRSPIIFNPFSLLFAVPEGKNSHLLETIDSYLAKWKSDPESPYYSITAKWFGQKEKEVLPDWVFRALLVGVGIALLVTVWVFILRRQVKIRTKELAGSREELQKAYVGVEKKVEERTGELQEKTVELEQANIRLQEMDRLKSVFLASMSHELRTPLNSIIGFTGIILQGMSGEVNEEQSRQLTMVKNSASHLLSLINDVLDISKIEAGKVGLSLEEFSLNGVVREVVKPLSPTASEKGLEVLTEVPESITLFSDRRRIKQVLINLVSNAVKFTDQGSVKITARVPGDDNLEIHVIDTGVGIKREDMDKLFQPFQQIDVSLTKKHEGTGLGLHLTKRLVTLLGGGISAKSEYGRGSEFTFTMPLRYNKEGQKK